MEPLIEAQVELYGRIARTHENLRKSGSAKVTKAFIATTLRLLDNKWQKFEENHERLFNTYRDEVKKHEYHLKDFLGQAEEIYTQQRAILLDMEDSLVRGANGEQAKPSAGTSLTPGNTLPRIQIPHFSGEYEEWPAYRDLFTSLIMKDTAISDVTRMHYLKTSLKGEAELLVKNLNTTGDNFALAWKSLADHYENKRLLVRSFYATLMALLKMKSESAAELRKLHLCARNTAGALANIGRPVQNSEDMFVCWITELLDPRTRARWEDHVGSSTLPPTFEELQEFLERRVLTLDALHKGKSETGSGKSNISKSIRAHHAQRERERCSLCRKDHFLMMCETYKRKSAAERRLHVDSASLCLNCLGKHKVSECVNKRCCTVCGERHHTTLHDACRVAREKAPSAVVQSQQSTEPAKTTHVMQHPSKGQLTVLLATARVNVADRAGEWYPARALVDQGSETSIISESLAQRLRLPRQRAAIAVYGVGGQQTAVARGQVSVSISSRIGQHTLSVSAIVLPRLTVYAGVSSVALRDWSHLRGLDLADPEFCASDSIELLLGADAYAAIIGPGIIKGGPREPIAQWTSFGWIVSGAVDEVSSHGAVRLHQCTLSDPLADLVRRFWEQEEVSQPSGVLTAEEQRCEEIFKETHSRSQDGRYQVRLPIKALLPNLMATRRAAVRMQERMEKRFERDPQFREIYASFLQQYEDLQHMSRAEQEGCEERTAYLPHHGVLKESSNSTKLRVVFNGSSTVEGGASLNSHLLTGPNLLPQLAEVLLRWRRYRYVFVTDVEKMYRQILVHPADRDLQRILWRPEKDARLEEYRLNTVTYGLACAPYLAIRTLQQLAEDEARRFPRGSEILQRDVYVDDILTGASTMEEALLIQGQLLGICTAGGFPLRKWAANDEALLSTIPEGDRAQPDPRAWTQGGTHSALGLQWHPSDDCFAFLGRTYERTIVTKRLVVSQAAQLFDPLGWLAPVIVRAKIYIQGMWLQGLEWDSPVNEEDARSWRQFLTDLPGVEGIKVPRWLPFSGNDDLLEVHGFADASERAYGAAVYLRKKEEHEWHVRLVIAKTKVAPLKQVSLPRLELSAATLLSRLVIHVGEVLGISERPVHLWTDSMVTLGWIRGHPSRWKTFVANRVSEIQTTLPNAHWHHVASQDNPADCASRGLTPSDLARHELWWRGPAWLAADATPWKDVVMPAEDLPEVRSQVHTVARGCATPEAELLCRYSSLQRLLRVTAWCLRWRQTQTCTRGEDPGMLTATEVELALVAWVRTVQASTYEKELRLLRKGNPLPSKSSVIRLRPFVDQLGILRVGGRIKHALLSYEEEHPMILPKTSTLTKLIVDSCHARTLHGGVQQTLALLRQRFWVPCGRALVKSHIQRCVRCVRWRAATPQQIMGDLPEARVTPSRPFLQCGVDYAGPVLLRTTRGRGHKAYKAYIAVFVCLSTRAVHLEVVSDCTTDAFLAAFRRFVSRRGLCQVMYSDCGTNFVGADAALRRLFQAGSVEARRIGQILAENRIQWRFNPPAAPHFGGLWEAAVKSAKHHLRRVIGEATLTFEEMATFLAQVEACLNSRPLQPLNDDPDDLTALTPGHFLVGSSLQAVPEPMADKSPHGVTRWQHITQMRNHFWERWAREYVPGLADRPKWRQGTAEPRVGQLCLLRNEITQPAKWPLARITALHPGQDGCVRVVTVRTASSEFRRPVVKLVMFPPNEGAETPEKQIVTM